MSIAKIRWIMSRIYMAHQNDLAKYIYGSAERVTEAMRSELRYPLMRADVFNDINILTTQKSGIAGGITRGSEVFAQYTCYIEILGNSEINDTPIEDGAEVLADVIAKQIITEIASNRVGGYPLYDEDTSVDVSRMEQIRRAYGDNDIGVRLWLQIAIKIKCQEPCSPITLYNPKLLSAGFTWKYIGSRQIEVLNTSTNLDPAAISTVYRAYTSVSQKVTEVLSYNAIIDIPPNTRHILVTQTVTDANGRTSEASAVIYIVEENCNDIKTYPLCGAAIPQV